MFFTRSSTDGTFTEMSTKLHASNPEADYHFGESVSLYGDTALIGATYDDDNGKSTSGSVYVFTRSSTDGTFTDRSKLHASNAAVWDRFAISVSLYGNTALIGAHGRDDDNDNTITNVGSVYVFKAPIVCSTDEYVSSNVCAPCGPGTTNDAGDNAWGSDTACTATLCSANEHVLSHVCTACGPGTTNDAGDDASGSDTVCGECAENYHVLSHVCTPCPSGTTNDADDDASGSNTTCDVTLCSANEYVSSNECISCPPGTTNDAGDNASGSNTICDATLCSANEYVSSHVCTSCPVGTINVAGDDASDNDTVCGECAENYYVSSHVCTSCPLGTINVAGDDASGSDTTCDDPYSYLGEGECRQSDGNYPIKFSKGYYDLNPHMIGTNAQQAMDRCKAKCILSSWCLAVEVMLRGIFPTPECRLVTDWNAYVVESGNIFQNNTWGGTQSIDGENYQTYCNDGSSPCSSSNVFNGGSLNSREKYYCYVKSLGQATQPTCNGGVIKTSSDGHKFCYKNGGLTFTSAEDFCKNNNMQLVEPKTQALSNAVDSVCGYDCTWLNLKCTPENPTNCDTSYDNWKWVSDGNSITSGYHKFRKKSDGTIYGGAPGEYCGHWWKTGGPNGSDWGPQTCSSTNYGALCLMESPSTL
jgi:hypothetical protein